MFKTGKTFLEYIFLLHGPPAVFRNKKIKKETTFAAFYIKVPSETESHNTTP